MRAAPIDVREFAAAVLLRPGWPRRPPLLDIVLAGAFVALTVAEAVSLSGTAQATKLWALSVPALASLAVRRQYPLLVACFVTNVNFVVNAQIEFTTVLSLVLVAFTVGHETRPPRSYFGLVLVLVPFMVNLARTQSVPSDIAAAMVFLVGPWVVGAQTRMRADRAEAAESRAAQLERR